MEDLQTMLSEAVGAVTGDENEEEVYEDPRKTLAELRERFRYADDYREQYAERAKRWYQLYVGYRDDVVEGRSNLHIPRAYEQLDTIRARLTKSFISQRPYVEFMPRILPRTTQDQVVDNERKADIASSLVDLQLDRNKIGSVFYDYVTSMLIFPCAIMSVGWRYEEKRVRRKEPIMGPVMDPQTGWPAIDWEKVQPMVDPQTGQPVMDPQTGQQIPDPNTMQPLIDVVGMEIVEKDEIAWDDNEVQNVDFFDFWPDPRGNDLDDCRFVFHREWMTRDDIEDKLEMLQMAHSGVVNEINWDEVTGDHGNLEEGKWERLTSVGISPETSHGYFDDDDDDEVSPGELYEVLNYWEDERYCILINRVALAYDGPNPYWRHSTKPFVASSFEPLPNEFYGMSAMQLIEHLQEEINTHRNQRIDNVSLVLNRMWKVRRGADIDESELISRPAGIIHVDNPDDITEFAMNDITASSYNEEQAAKTDMENTLGVPAVVRGADAGRSETATEVVTKSTNAGMRFDIKIMLFEALGFKRLARLMDLNNQQFIDDQRIINLVGEEGADQWKEVTPFDIIGEFDYRPAGASIDPAANKEVRRQQLSHMMQFIIQSQNPFIHLDKLTRTWAESFDLRNVDKLIKTEEEMQQEQYEAMVMQQMAQMEAQQRMAQQQQQEQAQAQEQAMAQQEQAQQEHAAMHQQAQQEAAMHEMAAQQQAEEQRMQQEAAMQNIII